MDRRAYCAAAYPTRTSLKRPQSRQTQRMIITAIRDLRTFAAKISSAIEEQSAATTGIAENLQLVAKSIGLSSGIFSNLTAKPVRPIRPPMRFLKQPSICLILRMTYGVTWIILYNTSDVHDRFKARSASVPLFWSAFNSRCTATIISPDERCLGSKHFQNAVCHRLQDKAW